MKRLIAVLIIIIMCFSAAPGADAAQVQSPSDISEFIPAEYVPFSLEIPDFYIAVENVRCLYVFEDSEGIMHKRWYGSIDGVYGFYEAHGATNTVYGDSRPIAEEEDRALLEGNPDDRDDDPVPEDDPGDYVGLIPPDEPVRTVGELFGVEIHRFLMYCVIAVGSLILLILLLSAVRRSRKRR